MAAAQQTDEKDLFADALEQLDKFDQRLKRMRRSMLLNHLLATGTTAGRWIRQNRKKGSKTRPILQVEVRRKIEVTRRGRDGYREKGPGRR